MTEEDKAIADLTNMVLGVEEETEEQTPEPTQPKEPVVKEEPNIKIDVAKIIAEQQKMVAEQNKKIAELESKMQTKANEVQNEEQSEEQRLIQEAQAKLGIDQQKLQALYQMQEEAQRAKAFDNMVAEFKKNNEDIDLKEMGKWAEENNLMSLLNSGDVNQWNVVANAMRAVAKASTRPDAITPSSQKGAEQTVWQRLEKGEKVDDIDLGIDLLKGVGGWN